MNEIKVGLALGSGAFRGLAHIGVLQVLVEEKIGVSAVAGSSMGAVVGSLYCCGLAPAFMERFVEQMDERALYDPMLPTRGLLRGARIEEVLRTLTRNRRVEELSIPFAAVAVDVESGERVTLREGFAWEAVRASMSVPGVFPPYALNGRRLIDGGILERVPMDAARELGADVVIGVDVGYRGGPHRAPRAIDVLFASIDIMQWEIMRLRGTKATPTDVWLVPELDEMNPWRMKGRERAVAAGREAALAALPAIRAAMQAARERGADALSSS